MAMSGGMAVIVPLLAWFRVEEAHEFSALLKQRLLRRQ
jgi:hypothetical protein